MININKRTLLPYLLFFLIFLSSCATQETQETRTFPESISYNNEYEVRMINHDGIPVAYKPTMYNGKIYYHSQPKSNVEPNLKYYVYDINSKKTSKTNVKDFELAQENTNQKITYGTTHLDRMFTYTYGNKEIIVANTSNSYDYVANQDYLVWVEKKALGDDLIYIMNLKDESVREIMPHEDLDYYSGKYFNYFNLAIVKDIVLVGSKRCTYSYDLITLNEKKVLCDDNLYTRWEIVDNMIVFTGNDRHSSKQGEEYRQDSFLIII